MWTRMSVGTLAEAEMDPDKYDKADANVSEADRRKIKNIDQPKGINRDERRDTGGSRDGSRQI